MRQLRSIAFQVAVSTYVFAFAPASAATLSVGAGKTYISPCKAFAAAKDGDVVEIAGDATYSSDVCGIYANKVTIRGVNGRPKIDAAGKNAMGKGTWVIVGNDIVIENIEMLGAKVPDQNGAALRLEGTNFTLRNAFIHNNENGILSGVNTASNIVIENSEFAHNGNGSGYTHNLYIGNAGSLVFRNNYSHDADVGHNLKSRARVNTIAYNRFSSTPDGQAGSGKPSYEIDLPNAGTSYVIGNVIQQPSANSNPSLLAYGEEGATNPGHDLYVVNNTFLNDDSSRGTFLLIGSSVSKPALVQNNIFAGTGTLATQTAVEKTNFRSASPGFVNRAGYDLHPTANPLVVDAGSAPGTSASGVSLVPVAQYKHTASSETRSTVGALDIGAYEAASTAATPTPTPTPTPIPTPEPTPGPTSWTTCAAENGICAFPGTAQVRYGAGDAYVVKTATGSIACSNAVFGDPASGVVKSCSYAASTAVTPPAPTPAPDSWVTCAAEGGTCSFNGTLQIRYGTATNFVTRTATGSIACSNAVFGDPAPGFVKSCSYANATAPVAPTWTTCASEGGTCTVSGTREVRFGAGTSYVSKVVTGLVQCTNAIFGDPAYGVAKSCSFSSIFG